MLQRIFQQQNSTIFCSILINIHYLHSAVKVSETQLQVGDGKRYMNYKSPTYNPYRAEYRIPHNKEA